MSTRLQKFPRPTTFQTILPSTDFFIIFGTKCKSYAASVNEPDIPDLNVFGVERSFAIVANDKGIRKGVATPICTSIEHDSDDSPLLGLLWYDHTCGNMNPTSRPPENPYRHIKPRSLEGKRGVMLRISSLSFTNDWSDLSSSLIHLCFFLSQQYSSFLLADSLCFFHDSLLLLSNYLETYKYLIDLLVTLARLS